MSRRKPHWDRVCIECHKNRALYVIQSLVDKKIMLNDEFRNIPRVFKKLSSYQIRTKPKLCYNCLIEVFKKEHSEGLEYPSCVFSNTDNLRKCLYRQSLQMNAVFEKWKDYQLGYSRHEGFIEKFFPFKLPVVIYWNKTADNKYHEEEYEKAQKKVNDIATHYRFDGYLQCLHDIKQDLSNHVTEIREQYNKLEIKGVP